MINDTQLKRPSPAVFLISNFILKKYFGYQNISFFANMSRLPQRSTVKRL